MQIGTDVISCEVQDAVGQRYSLTVAFKLAQLMSAACCPPYFDE